MTKKVKLYSNLLSYATSAKGDWHIKASVYKDTQVLLVCMNVYNQDFIMQFFDNHNDAVDFIQMLLFRGFTQG